MFFFKIIFFTYILFNFNSVETTLVKSQRCFDFSKLRGDEVVFEAPKLERSSCKPWEDMPNFNDQHPPPDCICITASE